jgi:hypothetical protein
VDIGAGRGVDDLWFARRGARVIGFDFALRGSQQVAAMAAREQLPVEFRRMNLLELRSVLAESARVAHLAGRKVVLARHIADATNEVGRTHLWRACEMMLRDGGRLYLEVLVARGRDDPFAQRNHVRPLKLGTVVRELQARGATVVSRDVTAEGPDNDKQHRTGRLVVEWQR